MRERVEAVGAIARQTDASASNADFEAARAGSLDGGCAAVAGEAGRPSEPLEQRAAECSARSESVRGQVEQLMLAFQFQDRAHQMTEQVATSIVVGADRMKASLVSGVAPDREAWLALLRSGTTTDEQRSTEIRCTTTTAADAGGTPSS